MHLLLSSRTSYILCSVSECSVSIVAASFRVKRTSRVCSNYSGNHEAMAPGSGRPFRPGICFNGPSGMESDHDDNSFNRWPHDIWF